MAEFGENIRKAREELGITQQTLADKLYVTRQAVSRWENGSRYPDLLTAKALAKSLDTSLDDLLADDDMHTYPEVNPVIEYPVHKRVQTALFSAACALHLILLIWDISYNLTDTRAFRTVYEAAWLIFGAVALFLITAVLLYGVVKSVKDAVTPRVAERIIISIVGLEITGQLTRYFLSLSNLTPIRHSVVVVSVVIDTAFILLVLWFFRAKKPRRPIPIYVIVGLYMALGLLSFFGNMIPLIGTSGLRSYLINSSLSSLSFLMIDILFIYMTAVLYRKRKLATQV